VNTALSGTCLVTRLLAYQEELYSMQLAGNLQQPSGLSASVCSVDWFLSKVSPS
jgi:hypothetical protein